MMRIFILSLCMLATYMGKAQLQADTLQTVNVVDKKSKKNDGHVGAKVDELNIENIDQPFQQSLQQYLQLHLPVYIHSLNNNSQASIMLRGASAQQTQVIWKGLPLNNASTGIADVSSMPLMLSEQIQLHYGANAAQFGSGNIGGTLILSTENSFYTSDTGFAQAAVGIGSYGKVAIGLGVQQQKKNTSIRIKAYSQRAKNNFQFVDYFDSVQTTSNASMQTFGLMADVAHRFKTKHNSNSSWIDISLWLQKNEREIPAALFEASSKKNRDDKQIRYVLSWHRNSEKTDFIALAGHSNEFMRYEDKDIAQWYEYHMNFFYAKAGWERVKLSPKFSAISYFPVQFSQLNSEMMGTVPRQWRAAYVAGISFNENNFKAELTNRFEVFDKKWVSIPGLGLQYRPTKTIEMGARIQKTYRIPTLNELYFFPGGNANLKPENGYSMEFSIAYKPGIELNKLTTHQNVGAYYRNIKDWIIWYGGAIWTPHNLAQVQSRGVEWMQSYFYRQSKMSWAIFLNTSYTLSTTQESYIPFDNSIGKQIPNTPFWMGLATAEAGSEIWKLRFTYQYTGLRYATIDQSISIPAYQLFNVQGIITKKFKTTEVNLGLYVNNIFNKEYQLMNGRPMPGRNILVNIGVTPKF